MLDDKGHSARQHLEQAARQKLAKYGVESAEYKLAASELEGPEFPEAVAYLLEWSDALVRRSGVGMDGYAPLSWNTINAWCARTGNQPTEPECFVLFALDAVRLHPPAEDS